MFSSVKSALQAIRGRVSTVPASTATISSDLVRNAALLNQIRTLQQQQDLVAKAALHFDPAPVYARLDRFPPVAPRTFEPAPTRPQLADERYQRVRDTYDAVRHNGGITVNLVGRQPTEGYAYAPRKDTQATVPRSPITLEDINRYRDKWYRELSEPGNHLGVWTEGNKVYLNVSRVGPASADTIAAAQAASQLAVFDLKTMTTINIGKIDDHGQYRRLGEATDLHAQHQRQVERATEGRSPGGIPKVPR